MGPNYEPGSKKDLYVKSVQRTVLCMGRKQEAVESVPCGNTVALVGLDQFITKTATLTNESCEDAHPMKVSSSSKWPFKRVPSQTCVYTNFCHATWLASHSSFRAAHMAACLYTRER